MLKRWGPFVSRGFVVFLRRSSEGVTAAQRRDPTVHYSFYSFLLFIWFVVAFSSYSERSDLFHAGQKYDWLGVAPTRRLRPPDPVSAGWVCVFQTHNPAAWADANSSLLSTAFSLSAFSYTLFLFNLRDPLFPRMKVLFGDAAYGGISSDESSLCTPSHRLSSLGLVLAFVIDGVSHEQRYRLERCERGFFGANRVSPILE